MNDNGISQFFKPGPDCLPVDDLAADLNLPEGSEQRRSAENHLATCAHCRNELELLYAFESGAIGEDERVAVEAITARLASATPKAQRVSAAWWQRLLSPTGFAAALAMAAALIVAINLDRGGSTRVEDGASDTLRSAPLRALSPLGEINSMPQEFRWTPVTGASTYSVTVVEVDRTLVFSGKASGTSFPIPGQVRDLLQTGKVLQWNVTAYDNAGRELASAALQRFQLKASP
jgi:hypothetical protein